ncbi:MAG: hypothetical protein K2O34_13430, partial [Acetatifactor sp.]|nr:hypothetical protein [Acetatifactor sp.]
MNRGGEQNFDAERFSDTSGTENMGAESLSGSGNLLDTGEESGTADEVPDEVERNLICLRDGDTESLIGISFGEEFDYDKYVIRGSTDEGWAYALKDSGYDSMYYLFDGEGNGFSGLIQYGDYFQGSSDFFGISVGEDRVERLSDVLGAYTIENKRSSSGTYTQAIWDFETVTLRALIEDGIIQNIWYLAKGGVANAPEKPEEETDFGGDRRDTEGCVEAVYNWSAYGPRSEGTYAILYPGLQIGDDEKPVYYDKAEKEDFLRSYLEDQGIYKEEPDGTLYDRDGNPSVEYYVDREKEQYCFILHMWAYYGDEYEDALYCTAWTLDDEGLFGHLIHEEDAAQGGVYERLYDRNGKKMAEVSYEYVQGMPFPFVSEEWNLYTGFHPGLLIRNQKTWFYKDYARFDQEGRFVSYEGDTNRGEYLPYSCRTVYDGDGRLKAIQEELLPEDIEEDWGWWDGSIDYSGQIEFIYDDDGRISDVEYMRSYTTHGTTDSNGRIKYDERGRMVRNSFYITHGGDTNIYLYEGDSDMPWCMIRWCSFAPGFEDVFLFVPQEQ